MANSEVRIVKLEPFRAASVHGFGETPEDEAWKKLEAWAKPKGLMDDLNEHPIFGFNNPSPSPGSPNYGYEFWIKVGPEVEPEGEVEIKDFPGGTYAILFCKVGGKPYETIPAAWKELALWIEESPYKTASRQCLEQHLETEGLPEGEFDLDLFWPVSK